VKQEIFLLSEETYNFFYEGSMKMMNEWDKWWSSEEQQWFWRKKLGWMFAKHKEIQIVANRTSTSTFSSKPLLFERESDFSNEWIILRKNKKNYFWTKQKNSYEWVWK
jgi:hypothetical protein